MAAGKKVITYDRSIFDGEIPLEPEVEKELRILFGKKKEIRLNAKGNKEATPPRKTGKTSGKQDAMNYRLPGSYGTGKRQ